MMTLMSAHKMFLPTIFANMRLALQFLHLNQLPALNLPHPTHSWPTLLVAPLLSLYQHLNLLPNSIDL